MHYAAHYSRLIERARGRVLSGYRELLWVGKVGNKYGAANKGRVVTLEQRAQIAATLRGRALSPEHRAVISAGLRRNPTLKGRKRSPETIQRIIAAAARPETKAKRIAAHTGKRHSAETIAKISAAKRGTRPSEEHRAKLRATSKAYWERMRCSASMGDS